MLNYSADWLLENRVIHIQASGEFELSAMQQGIQRVKHMVDTGTAPVHVVWDMTGITKMPRDIREPLGELEILRYHPNGGWIVMVSNNVMIRFVGQIATRLLGANFRSVVSYDEAVETICRIDPGIEDMLRQATPSPLPDQTT